MSFQAVIWPRFNGNANALCPRVLGEGDCLSDRLARMTAEGVVQISNKVVPVLDWQRHEGASHDDELHLIH